MPIIHNAKYNSLPEQVQENKENIKLLSENGLIINPRGAWSSGTAYHKNDLVFFQGSSYLCIEDNAGFQPGQMTSTGYWQEIAAQGMKGDTGAKGATGETGAKGATGETGVGIDTISNEPAYISGDKTITPLNVVLTDGTVIDDLTVTAQNGKDGKDGTNGTNGTDGAQGEPGLDALVYNQIVDQDLPIHPGTVLFLDGANFNRTPVVGEKLNVVINEVIGLTNKTYIADCLIMSKDSTYDSWLTQIVAYTPNMNGRSIDSVVTLSHRVEGSETITTAQINYSDGNPQNIEIHAQNGSNERLYAHNILIYLDNAVSSTYVFRFTIFSTRSTEFTSLTDLNAYLVENGAQQINAIWSIGGPTRIRNAYAIYGISEGDILVDSFEFVLTGTTLSLDSKGGFTINPSSTIKDTVI